MVNIATSRISDQSDAGDEKMFIVDPGPGTDLDLISALPTRAERREALRASYQQIKHPALETIDRYAGAGIRVVDLLEDSPQFLIAGPVLALEKMVEEQSEFFDDANISLIPNDPMGFASAGE
jgi:hypothetical protein